MIAPGYRQMRTGTREVSSPRKAHIGDWVKGRRDPAKGNVKGLAVMGMAMVGRFQGQAGHFALL